jgi:hypothetical protein
VWEFVIEVADRNVVDSIDRASWYSFVCHGMQVELLPDNIDIFKPMGRLIRCQ